MTSEDIKHQLIIITRRAEGQWTKPYRAKAPRAKTHRIQAHWTKTHQAKDHLDKNASA